WLLREFRRGLDSTDIPWLEGRCVSYRSTTPYLPMVDLLRSYFRIADSDDGPRMREKVTARLRALDPRLEATLPALLTSLDVATEDPEWQALDPAQRRQRTLVGLKQLWLRESQARPLVLVFENVHWIDTETQAFLDSLVDSLPSSRVLLLVSCRPQY